MMNQPETNTPIRPSAARAVQGCSKKSRRALRAVCFAVLFLTPLLFALPAVATPSQSDVFKSIQDNVNQSDTSSGSVIPWVCAGVGLILLIALFGRRQTRQATPKTLNNPNRLMKEISNAISLKPKELKQLKVVAEETTKGKDEDDLNPLVLLLCPSLMTKALDNRTTRADRKTIVMLLKKSGVR